MPKRHTLLVLDDEPDVVKSVRDLLRLEYNVLTATSAAEGMKLLADHEVHVVMTDQRMPGMTGVEFLQNIRGDHPEAVRLLFTGYADIKAVIDAINAGNVYRYIGKPWDPEELHAIIREACERYDLLAERRQLTADLQAKNAELERANQLKAAFIQVASHELRTPLTILLGLSDLAVRSAGVVEPVKGWLGRIKGAAERLQHLVNQIVTMLAAGRFEQEIVKTPTDLDALLSDAADDVLPFVELRKQTLIRDWPSDLGTLAVEPIRLRDGIDHLLLNAIKFTGDGGTITVHARRTETGGARIAVTDTGVGISPEHQQHLFEPFFTGFGVSRHSSGHFEYLKQGLGLGLSVVKAFVTLHGGTLDVRSEPGQGTTFTMTLPGA